MIFQTPFIIIFINEYFSDPTQYCLVSLLIFDLTSLLVIFSFFIIVISPVVSVWRNPSRMAMTRAHKLINFVDFTVEAGLGFWVWHIRQVHPVHEKIYVSSKNEEWPTKLKKPRKDSLLRSLFKVNIHWSHQPEKLQRKPPSLLFL